MVHVASGQSGQVTWQSWNRVNHDDETANVTSAVQQDVEELPVVDFVVRPGRELHQGVAMQPALSLCIAAGCSPEKIKKKKFLIPAGIDSGIIIFFLLHPLKK